jgi:hypothetical protein
MMPHVLVGYLATRLSVVHDVCTWCVNGASTCEGWSEEAIVLGMYKFFYLKPLCIVQWQFVVHGSLT